MVCRKCRTALPDGSKYCLSCGAKQDITRRPRSRGNGTGSVYQLPSKTWIAVRICGWYTAEDGSIRRKTRSKSGFRTKKEALEYLPLLAVTPAQERSRHITYKELYDKWYPTHRAGESSLGCYRAAIKHFRPLWSAQLADIDVDDLQECMDDCPAGKRTRENMKALCGLLYKYAIPRHMATLNLGEYLIVGGGVSEEKRALPMEAVQALQQAGASLPTGSTSWPNAISASDPRSCWRWISRTTTPDCGALLAALRRMRAAAVSSRSRPRSSPSLTGCWPAGPPDLCLSAPPADA